MILAGREGTLAELGLDVVVTTPDEFAAYIKAEIARWAKRSLGMRGSGKSNDLETPGHLQAAGSRPGRHAFLDLSQDLCCSNR